MKNVLITTARSWLPLISIALPGGALVCHAQELPEASKALLLKLETFEKEKRQEIENEIQLKRAQVLELLKGQVTKHPPGSAKANGVETAIAAVENLDASKPFKLSSIKVSHAPTSSKNAQINFELMLKRLAVTALNHDSRARLKAEHMIEVKLDNKVIYTKKTEGACVLDINPEGKMVAHTFNHIGSDKVREIKAERERMMSILRKIDPGHVVVIAKASACNTLSLGGEADDIVEIIGGRVKSLPFRKPYVCIGYQGLRRGDAVEVEGAAARGDAMAAYPPGKD